MSATGIAILTRVGPLDEAEMVIATLREFPPITPDEILLLRNRLAEFKRRATELLNIIDEQVLTPFVKQNGPIEIAPGVRWVMKLDKTIKPISLRSLVEGIYEITGGDFDRFVDCLSVNAFKPGECRKVLMDRFDEFFVTEVKEDVELKQPKKVLALVNENFTR